MTTYTPEQVKAIGMEAARYLAAHGDPGDFARYATKGMWKRARHLALITEKLVKVASGEIPRLLIQMGPRHGKSMLISHFFPVWYLGHNPDKRIILASYSDNFAAEWGGKARDEMKAHGRNLWGLEVRKDRKASGHWGLVGHLGEMLCVGASGGVTGHGGDLLIADDLIKDAEAAESETIRDNTWDWWRSSFYTRLEPGGSIVFITTRWNLDDVAARLQGLEGDRWEIISLPSLAEADDPLGRAPGEALWPERFPANAADREARGLPKNYETLADIQETQGPYFFGALHQQHPSPPQGTLLKREDWRFYGELPDNLDDQILSVDCAFKDTKDSSFVVIQVWGRAGADLFFIDQFRDRMGFAKTVENIEAMSAKWPNARYELIEDKANGSAVIETLQQRMSGVIGVNPEGGKHSRAQTASLLQTRGQLWLPQPEKQTWVQEFIDECANFPVGRYNDMVDAMSQAVIWLAPLLRDEPRADVKKMTALQASVVGAIEDMEEERGGDIAWVHPTSVPAPTLPV